MTIASELVPWLTVVVIVLCATVVGIIAVRRLAPSVLVAAPDSGGTLGKTDTDGVKTRRTDTAADITAVDDTKGRTDPDSETAAVSDVEGGVGDRDSKQPHRFAHDRLVSAIERAVTVGPVEPTPATLNLHDTVDVVSRTDTEAERLSAFELTPTPATITTRGRIRVTSKENRLSAVEIAPTPVTVTTADLIDVMSKEVQLDAVEVVEATGEADGIEGDTGIRCEYCGRDDFETAAQRNGHLRWCDEYEQGAAATADEEESETAEQSEHRTVEVAEAAGTTRENDGRDGGNERVEAVAAGSDGHSDSGAVTGVDTTEAVRESTVDKATDEDIDVVATYAAVRQQLRKELDISNRRTSQEFYHVCRSRGLDEQRLAALERLTQAYETVQYSDNPDVNADEIRAAAAQFETAEGGEHRAA